MRFLTLFDSFVAHFTWLAIVVVLILGVWLFGKRSFVLKVVVKRFPLPAAIVDLIAGVGMILLLGSLVQGVFARFGVVDVTTQLADVVLLSLLLVIARCLARFTELFLMLTHKKDDVPYLPGLQRGLLFSGFMLIGLFAFLYLQGYSITGLYISTGAVAALVAFAMQQTLGDLFSGIALSIEHPFKLGERIRLADGSEGKVIDINWRATRLQAWDNSTLVIPNSALAKQGFQNLHGLDHTYAPWYEIKIPAEVDPRLAQAMLLEAALRCEKVLKDPLPLVRLKDATTVPYTYMVWVHFPNYGAMFAGREQLFHEIHYALKDVGAQVSPTINELHTRRADMVKVEPPTALLALKMLDIAKSLSDEELEQLAQMSQRRIFEAGAVIVPEGDIAQSIDVVIHGVVEASLTTQLGSKKAVDQLRSGQYFGLTSMLMDAPSFLQFTASTNVTLIRIDINCLKRILVNRPDLHDAFARIMQQRMDAAQNMRLANENAGKRFTIKDFLRRMEQLTH